MLLWTAIIEEYPNTHMLILYLAYSSLVPGYIRKSGTQDISMVIPQGGYPTDYWVPV